MMKCKQGFDALKDINKYDNSLDKYDIGKILKIFMILYYI